MNATSPTYTRIIVAGQEVADHIAVLKTAHVPQTLGKLYDSEALCAFQQRVSQDGYVEAEIVESIYGFGLRYASGLQNRGVIVSARSSQCDGTFESAVAAARRWQEQSPTRRYVSYLSTKT